VSSKYKIRDQDELYFVTFTVVKWLDVFIRKDYADVFLDSIRFCQKNKGLELWCFVIMSSHVHMIVGRHGEQRLEEILRDIKKYTSVKIIEAIANNEKESRREYLMWFFEREGKRNSHNTRFQFWQHGSHPVEMSTNDTLWQRIDYIHNNPVVAGIVLSAEDYLYSSALNYAGRPEKLMEVMLA
jgi:REP element-mobilizing transposase RayT